MPAAAGDVRRLVRAISNPPSLPPQERGGGLTSSHACRVAVDPVVAGVRCHASQVRPIAFGRSVDAAAGGGAGGAQSTTWLAARQHNSALSVRPAVRPSAFFSHSRAPTRSSSWAQANSSEDVTHSRRRNKSQQLDLQYERGNGGHAHRLETGVAVYE